MRYINDIQSLYTIIMNKYGISALEKYLQENQNLIFAETLPSEKLVIAKESLLRQQKNFHKRVQMEIELLDNIGIEFIGLKGIFLNNSYYKNVQRSYGDIDILVKSENAGDFYKKLKQIGYRIQLKTMYDSPILNMKICPKYYMDHTQTLMLINKKNIEIDLHSNLNITNAHFTKTDVKFNTNYFFNNAIKFENYKNIYQLETYDCLCFLFRHLLKHHVFYGKTQTGLATPVQLVLDLAFIINSENFDITKLYSRIIEYNVIPEAIYSLNLYNKLFKNSGQKIDLFPLINKLKSCSYHIKWAPILEVSLQMDIEDLMVGNFSSQFPMLYRVISKCEELPPTLNYLIQGFLVNPFVPKLL